MIRFIETSFLPGCELTGLDDAQRQLEAWLSEANARVHRTHGEVVDDRFAREAPLLTSLPPYLRIVERTATRIVSVEGTIEYRANRYELPAGFRGRSLLVRDDGRVLRVFAGSELIYSHELVAGKGRVVRQERRHTSRELVNSVEVAQRSLDEYDEVSA